MTDKKLRQIEEHIADLELMVSLGEDRENELEQALNRANTQYEKVVEQNQSLQQDTSKLKAENEEYKKLKEYLKISEITILEDGDLILTSKVFDKVVQNNNKLKQALKDIENCLTVLNCPQFNENEDIHPIQAGSVCASVILDIINKAKEE